MLSDEEKREYEELKSLLYTGTISQYGKRKLIDIIEKQSKEIEELKEDRKSYSEEYIHNNPWLYKQLNEVYMLRTESEQKQKEAYIKGTNDADELCNKKWEDKIKAKIEEQDKIINTGGIDFNTKSYARCKKEFGQSLLEKE